MSLRMTNVDTTAQAARATTARSCHVECVTCHVSRVRCNHLDQEQVGVPVEDAVVSVEGEPLGDGVLLREDPHCDHPPHAAQPVHCNSQDR